MAEELTDYLNELGIRARYLHSDITTIERSKIIQELRKGLFHVLVGINLLREGLDMPEVSLIAILDADKEGFLRSERSLIQTAGRAARNIHGEVILYADTVTESMRRAIEETKRRREIQAVYNRTHGISPRGIEKAKRETLFSLYESEREGPDLDLRESETIYRKKGLSQKELQRLIEKVEGEMRKAAEKMDFERAAVLRDQYLELRARLA